MHPQFSLIDISNFNLGIFLYLVDNMETKLLLDLQNRTLEVSNIEMTLTHNSFVQNYQDT